MKLAAAFVIAAVLAAPQAAAKGPTPPRSVVGIVSQGRQTSVVELNALTLKAVSRAAPLGRGGRYLGRSPGRGARGAFAAGEAGNRIVFVDLRAMRGEGALTLPCALRAPITWETASRLVMTCDGPASSVLVVDPVKRKLRGRTALRGSLFDVQAAAGALVGILAPLDGIGPARLVVVSANGRVRTVALPGVRAGTEVVDQERYRVRTEQPALAVDRNGRRAVVVPAVGAVVEVDLARLDVAAHTLLVRTPAATRKELEGTVRHAVWTWSGTIAVSGTDGVPGQAHAWRAAGVTLIDAHDWTSRFLGSGTNVATNGWSLLGWSSLWDAAAQRQIGGGLTGYAADGAQRFHLFGDDAVSVAAVAGTYAYVTSTDFMRYRIDDTESGKVVGNVRTARPTTLVSPTPY